MNGVEGVVKEGKIVLDSLPNWPEGSRVIVRPLQRGDANGTKGERLLRGMTEDEQGDDPESIAKWLAEYDALEPLRISAEEEADLNAWRKKMREYNVEAVRRQMEEGLP
jgi:hypothetical protein